MNIYIPLCLLLAIICLLCRNNERTARKVFFFAMLSIFILAALRYEFGPDYFSYQMIFENVKATDFHDYTGVGSTMEPMFLFYMSLFSKYSLFIAVNSFLWFLSYFLFFRSNAEYKYLWFIFLFLMLDPNGVTGNLVAMRTAFCGVLFLLAFHFLSQGNKLLYCAIIVFAGFIHTSSFLLVLLVFVNKKQTSLLFSNVFVIVAILVGLSTFFVGENWLISSVSEFLMDSYEELQRYEGYSVSGASSSVKALVFKILSIIIFVSLYSAAKKESDPKYIIIYKTAILASLLPLVMGQTIISDRFMSMLNPVFIFALVRSVRYLNKEWFTLSLISCISISIYLLYVKMTKDYRISFLQYHTIFSAPYIP